MTDESVVQQTTSEAMANAAQEVKQVATEMKQVAESTKEVAKEAASITAHGLEQGTNEALHFLGVPIDANTLIRDGMDWGINFVLALIIFFVGKWVGKRIVNVAKLMMARSRLDSTAANFLGNLLYGVMLVAVILAALNKLGVNTNSFVAVLGAVGVAIGVSLKDQLSNLAAGVLIVIFRPFGRGDSVEIGGKIGTVIDITLVNTRIKTAANHEIIIPNGDIMTTSSTNFSSLPTRRVEVVVGIDYQSDIQKAREAMLAVASRHELILQQPDPIVRVTALSESSVDLTLYVWTENGDWFGVQCDLLEQIKYAFDEAGIGIPFPNRTVHLEGVENLAKIMQEQTLLTSKSNHETIAK